MEKFRVEFHYFVGGVVETHAEDQEKANEKIEELMGELGEAGLEVLDGYDIGHREFDACKA